MKKPVLPGEDATVGKVLKRFKKIASEMREDRGTSLQSKRRSRLPNQHFKRRAYKLISHYVENGYHHVFPMVLSELSSIPKTSIQPDENPFFWGLAAVCGDENIFSMNQLRRNANGMNSAFESNVPAEKLIKFLRKLNS